MPILRVKKDDQVIDVQIDKEDVKTVMSYVWTIEEGRPVTKISGQYVSMHRMLMGAVRGDGVLIDHIDGNPLNNTRKNLRRANRFENQQNRKTNKDNTLPKGIRKLPSGMYNVRVQTYNKRIGIGTYATLEEAINARNEAARKLHGQFFRESYDLNEKESKEVDQVH